ncbi:MAG: hypothetical protein ABH859_01545 [Pseudomonadota bacterium]
MDLSTTESKINLVSILAVTIFIPPTGRALAMIACIYGQYSMIRHGLGYALSETRQDRAHHAIGFGNGFTIAILGSLICLPYLFTTRVPTRSIVPAHTSASLSRLQDTFGQLVGYLRRPRLMQDPRAMLEARLHARDARALLRDFFARNEFPVQIRTRLIGRLNQLVNFLTNALRATRKYNQTEAIHPPAEQPIGEIPASPFPLSVSRLERPEAFTGLGVNGAHGGNFAGVGNFLNASSTRTVGEIDSYLQSLRSPRGGLTGEPLQLLPAEVRSLFDRYSELQELLARAVDRIEGFDFRPDMGWFELNNLEFSAGNHPNFPRTLFLEFYSIVENLFFVAGRIVHPAISSLENRARILHPYANLMQINIGDGIQGLRDFLRPVFEDTSTPAVIATSTQRSDRINVEQLTNGTLTGELIVASVPISIGARTNVAIYLVRNGDQLAFNQALQRVGSYSAFEIRVVNGEQYFGLVDTQFANPGGAHSAVRRGFGLWSNQNTSRMGFESKGYLLKGVDGKLILFIHDMSGNLTCEFIDAARNFLQQVGYDPQIEINGQID